MKKITTAAIEPTANALQLFRKTDYVVLHRICRAFAAVCFLCVASIPLVAQTSTTTTDAAAAVQAAEKKMPLDLALRSIAVLEWTGPTGKPTSSLLVPVAIYTDDHYQDGDDYLADPVPLAVQMGTQYVLQQAGVPQGNYDLDAAGKLRGDWFGSGTWEPLNVPNPYVATSAAPKAKPTGDSDRPHFSANGNSGPDGQPLPTLHVRPPKNAPKTPPPDPNRPIMAYGKPPQQIATAFPAADTGSRQQMVAISDSATHPVVSFAYPWANAAAKNSMHRQVELLAQRLLQSSLLAKAKAQADAAAATSAADQAAQDSPPKLMRRPKAKPAAAATPAAPTTPELPPLSKVDTRCFALTPGKTPSAETPTCILSAESIVQGCPTRYVTVIAQPDIYGVPQSISQAITDASDLHIHPRARLVDILDAAANGQGDILFEIDGAKQRQFGIYQVSGGKVKLAYISPKLPF
ncbi:MAG: hypothetical protein ACYDC6_03360 [Acidobacteriaceae bacterium]